MASADLLRTFAEGSFRRSINAGERRKLGYMTDTSRVLIGS